MKSELILIATYLTDQYESKKHGGYEVYEDDKIKIMYDTYYPNVCVYVKIDSKKDLAAIYSGHGHIQEYHPGHWEKYVSDKLYPAALLAKDEYLKAKELKKRRDLEKKQSRLNDAHVFE